MVLLALGVEPNSQRRRTKRSDLDQSSLELLLQSEPSDSRTQVLEADTSLCNSGYVTVGFGMIGAIIGVCVCACVCVCVCVCVYTIGLVVSACGVQSKQVKALSRPDPL